MLAESAKTMNPDIARWNQKYAAGDGVVEPKPEPEWLLQPEESPFRRMPAGEDHIGLDLACGKGAASLYLASLGYRMLAVDGAIEGLRICQAQSHLLSLSVQPVVMDLERAQLKEAAFDVINVVRYLNRSLFPALAEALAPGGTLFYKTFNVDHLRERPGFNPEYLLQPGELETAFGELNILESGASNGSGYIFAQKC